MTLVRGVRWTSGKRPSSSKGTWAAHLIRSLKQTSGPINACEGSGLKGGPPAIANGDWIDRLTRWIDRSADQSWDYPRRIIRREEECLVRGPWDFSEFRMGTSITFFRREKYIPARRARARMTQAPSSGPPSFMWKASKDRARRAISAAISAGKWDGTVCPALLTKVLSPRYRP